jgi:hypothetical protein
MHAWLVRGRLEFALGRADAGPGFAAEPRTACSATRAIRFYLQQILQEPGRHLRPCWATGSNAYLHLQQYQQYYEAHSKSARDSRILMRKLEKEMRSLKEERDRALEQQAQRETENHKLESLNKELAHQIHHVNSLQSTLKEQAIRDHLTGPVQPPPFRDLPERRAARGEDRSRSRWSSSTSTISSRQRHLRPSFRRRGAGAVRAPDGKPAARQRHDLPLRRRGILPAAARSGCARGGQDARRMALRYRELVVAQGGQWSAAALSRPAWPSSAPRPARAASC